MTVLDTDAGIGPRLSWRAIFAGAVIAVAIGAMLNLLGVAMGAAALDPYDMTRGDAKGLAVAGGIWLALSNAVGLLVGAWLVARFGPHPDPWRLRGEGLNSIAIWAVAFLLALAIAGFSGTGFLGTMIRGAAEQPQAVAEAIDDTVAPLPGDAGDAEPVAPTSSAAVAVDKSANAASGVAGWGFLNMLLGLIAALAGGWLAAKGPRTGGRVHERERVYTTSSADPRV